jgi:hypothetical protein
VLLVLEMWQCQTYFAPPVRAAWDRYTPPAVLIAAPAKSNFMMIRATVPAHGNGFFHPVSLAQEASAPP